MNGRIRPSRSGENTDAVTKTTRSKRPYLVSTTLKPNCGDAAHARFRSNRFMRM